MQFFNVDKLLLEKYDVRKKKFFIHRTLCPYRKTQSEKRAFLHLILRRARNCSLFWGRGEKRCYASDWMFITGNTALKKVSRNGFQEFTRLTGIRKGGRKKKNGIIFFSFEVKKKFTD